MLCSSLTTPLSSFSLALKAKVNERKLQMSRLFAICSTLKCTLVLLWRRSVCNFIWKLLFHKDFCLQTCFSLQKWLMPWNKSFVSLKLASKMNRYLFCISITTSTSSLLQSILVKVSVLWYYTNPNGIFRSLFPKFCILRFCDLFQSPSNYLVDEIPLESGASATKKEGSTSKGDDRSRWRKRETRDFFWTPPCWNPQYISRIVYLARRC